MERVVSFLVALVLVLIPMVGTIPVMASDANLTDNTVTAAVTAPSDTESEAAPAGEDKPVAVAETPPDEENELSDPDTTPEENGENTTPGNSDPAVPETLPGATTDPSVATDSDATTTTSPITTQSLVRAVGDVFIDATNFPDEKFRDYLLSQNYGADSTLSVTEIDTIEALNVYNLGISDLTGIKYSRLPKQLIT